jgi:hypothetical protein
MAEICDAFPNLEVVVLGYSQTIRCTPCPEFSIPNTKYRVDGYIVESKTVLEFLGDFYHGCPEHTVNFKHKLGGISPAQRHALTIDRIVKLKKMG